MKDRPSVFFNSHRSVGHISSGLYQPIDLTHLGHRVIGKTDSALLRTVRKLTIFIASGFLIGGVMGEMYVGDNLQYGQFEFVTAFSPLLQAVNLPVNLSMIFSGALLGILISIIAGSLSFVSIPE